MTTHQMTYETFVAITALQEARVALEAMRLVVIGQDARDQLQNVINILDHVLSVVIPAMIDEGKQDRIPDMVDRMRVAVADVVEIQFINTPPGAVFELAKGAAKELNAIVRSSTSLFADLAKPALVVGGIYFTWRIVDALRSRKR